MDVLFANVSGGWPGTYSYTDTYFADVNGDGLPDLVTEDGIRFNMLDSYGHPNFSELLDTRDTAHEDTTITINNSVCGQITLNGEVDEHLYCRLTAYVKDSYNFTSLLPNDYEDSEWRSETFNGGELRDSSFVHYLQDENLYTVPYPEGIYVCSLGYDTCERERLDPNIEVSRVWVAPQNGTVQISGTAHMVSDTSYSHQQSQHADGVICYIQKSSNISFAGLKVASSTDTELTHMTLNDGDTLPHTISTTTTVNAGDVILFRIFFRDNTDYDRVRWEQQVTYTSLAGQSYNSATDYVCVGKNNFVAPYDGSVKASVICNNDGGNPVVVNVRYCSVSGSQTDSCLTISPHASDTLICRYTNVSDSDSIRVWLSGSNVVWSDVHAFPVIDFTSDTIGQGRTITYYPDIHIQGVSPDLSPSAYLPSNLPEDKYRSLFGGTLYRGWGQLAYNWTASSATNYSTIPLNGLYNTSDSTMALINQRDTSHYKQDMAAAIQGIDSVHLHDFTPDSLESRIQQYNLYNPLTINPWVQMTPDSRSERYIAYGQLGFVSRYNQANTRVTDNTTIFNDTLYSTSIQHPEIVTYDSPFPKTGMDGRLITIRKSSKTKQKRISAGVSCGPLGMAASEVTNEQKVESDYLDMNGDGFPDFVGRFNGIQYSTPWGGIGELKITNLSPYINHSSSDGNNFSGGHGGDPEKIPGNGQTSGRYTIKACPGSVGISQGHNQGYSETKKTYVDINGDGLPDKVDIDSNTVAYNIGYSFLNPIPFDSLIAVNEGSCWGVSGGENFGGSIAFIYELIEKGLINFSNLSDLQKIRFSAAQVSISAGINLSTSDDHTSMRLCDVNGDGLPDLLSISNGGVKVSYNTGGSFASPQIINLNSIMTNKSYNVGVNLGLTGGFTFLGIIKLTAGLQSTPWSESVSQTKGDLIDMNGDGYPDWVQATLDGLAVRHHRGARTNLLTSVTNPTGQKIELEYTLSEPSTRHRQRQWNLTQVTDSDRLNPNSDLQSIRTMIQYLNPHYDSYERTDYGYKTVITQIGDKRLTQHFQNEAYMLHGEKTKDLLSDTLNTPFIGHRYSRGFFLGGDPSQTLDTVASALCQDADIHIHHNGDWTDWYEGHSDPQLSMLTQSFYDSLYNLTRFVHHGIYAVPGDEWTQNIDYATHYDHNLISLPIRERVTSAGTTLRKSEAEYNHYGSPERISMIDTATNITLSTYLTYDSLGHPIRALYPTGMQLDITYDTDVQTYPASVSNSFNETTLTDYDMRWGRPIRTTDPANNVIYYDYDVSGRLVSVLAPFESDAGLNHTVEYLYHNRGHNLSSLVHSNFQETDTFTYVTKVMHSTYSLQPDTEIVIFDARGKELQRKRLMTVGSSKKWISSGHTIFDQFYRPIQQYYPCQISSALVQDYDHIVSPTCTSPTITQYDVLDRPVSVEYPDHATEHMAYDVEDNALHTIHTDANSNRQDIYKSPQDWTLRTREGTDSMTIYQYNPIGELVRVTDAEGYRTDYTYDMFGHTTSRTHPDNGTTRWIYDANGLLEHMQTQRLYNNNQTIDYKYDRGRLTDVITPYSASIHYDYNSAGRISKRWDASGTEEFAYDALGNVSRSVRRLAVPTEADVYVFQTDYLYDSYGRMQQITYPDGEKVNYHYGVGGMLSDMESNYYGTICEREYDERGNRVYQYFGNGTKTNYFYSTTRNWLSQFESNNGSGMFSSKHYTFDPVGNVASTSINEGASPAFASWNTDYLYDNRNRLVQTHDAYDYGVMYSPTNKIWHKAYTTALPGSITTQFNLIYGYDADTITHQPRVIYDDHSASSLALFWDADGNLAEMLDCDRNKVRFHRWNDFDRLTLSLGHDFCGYYGYDADGIRTYKFMGTCNISTQNGGDLQAQAVFDDAVLYPSPYMVVTPKGYTNHYYAGSERIASRIGDRCWTITARDDWERPAPETEAREAFWNIGKEKYPFGTMSDYSSTTINTTFDAGYIGKVQYQCGAIELPSVDILYVTNMLEATIDCDVSYQNSAPIYYYHPDHLGSTSWVTDETGTEQQFLAYLPYGEPLMDLHLKTYDGRHGPNDIRYKFTGKERDRETGYDYMEQRYYYPPLAFWLRPDPLLDKYIHLSPYVYCNGNPLKYVDPEGEQIGIVGTIINEDGSPSVATFYYGEYEGIRGFYYDGICLNNDFADKATDAIGYIYDGGPMGKMLIDAVVNDDRIIYLCPTKYENQSKCALGKLDWTASDFNLGVLYTPSYIALSHELAHFLSYWYLFADYNTWYMNGMDKITNDEKWAVNVENLIRNENHLEPRMYYTIPSLPGVSGMGVIPQWDWVKDRLEILGHF
ncbi:MAG: hypothetical protein IJU36_06100 [Paludibacteraceae bacterium]|nr:hypothetical protein [Paludibacteraceae bacterium]